IYWLLRTTDELARVLDSLERAVAAGTLKITERAGGARVAQLDIHNKGRVPVYLQAGATLQGGKQDRTLASDVVVPPLTKLSVPTYCIERSRWSGTNTFGKSKKLAFLAPSRGLKIYTQYPMNHQQQSVWDEVGVLKAEAIKAGALSGSKSSSLNEELGKIVTTKPFRRYVDQLESAEPPADAIGAVVVINGRVANIDLYGHRKLFRQQWAKLRNSAAFEALIYKPRDKDGKPKDKDGKPEKTGEEGTQQKAAAASDKKDDVVAIVRDALTWWQSRPKPHRTRKTGPVRQRVIGKRDGERVMFDYVYSDRSLHVQIVFPKKRSG
ncbi:MAG: ARPP-1 family domain-containing protein, partial [Planctomycetota bacterium]